MVGSCATRNRESGQARKGAAVNGDPRVPQERPPGARCRGSVGFAAVENDGVAVISSLRHRAHPRHPTYQATLRRTVCAGGVTAATG